MSNLRGTSAYVGLGISMEQIEKHLDDAQRAGINMLFTSLQLPESDKRALLKEVPQLTQMAHARGISVDADVAPRTMSMFGIGRMDTRAFKQFGLDVIRLDYGYSLEETVELTHNTEGLIVELNASVPPAEQRGHIKRMIEAGINLSAVRACHNYYPKRYTGLLYPETVEMNACLHEFGISVGGFIASRAHQRHVCGDGLPTMERQREAAVYTQAQELMLSGMDFFFIGDDLASYDELKTVADATSGAVELRIQPHEESEALTWLLGREFKKSPANLDTFIRAGFGWERPECLKNYPGNTHRERRKGDVTIDLPSYYRYAGEINIVLKTLPADERISLMAQIVEDDRQILDILTGNELIKLVRGK